MLKFIKHHMSTITDIEVFPLIAFMLFFLIFIVATWIAITKRRSFMDHMAELPLVSDDGRESVRSEGGDVRTSDRP